MRLPSLPSVALLGFLFASAAYWLPAAPNLQVGLVRGFPRYTVAVPVYLGYDTNDLADVVALQADVVFDATGITSGQPERSDLLTNHVLISSIPAAGIRRLLLYSPANGTLTNGELARIPFTVAPDEYRTFSLVLTNVVLIRADASRLYETDVNGGVAVNQVFFGPASRADGYLNVTSNGVAQCYVIQATTNFVSWVNVQTNTTAGSRLLFVDAAASASPRRFYRAIACNALSASQPSVITQLPNHQMQLTFPAVGGGNYVIQASTNLIHWENLGTAASVNGQVQFTDSYDNYTRRFYRVQAVP